MNGALPNESRKQRTDWDPCPQGEIGGMVQRIRRRRRQVFAVKLATGAALGGIVVATIAFNVDVPQNGHFGGITCADVAVHMVAYSEGKLAPQLMRQIETHLAECPQCGSRYRQIMRDRRAQDAQQTSTQTESARSLWTVIAFVSSSIWQVGDWLLHA